MPGKEWEQPKNYVELTESQIFEKIKEDLNPIQENLAEKKITINEAKSELKKINEWLQWTKLETKDKKELWKAFENLIKLEKNIDENSLKDEVNEIINLLETLTKKDLANLEKNIKQKHIPWQSEQGYENENQYLTRADLWRKEASDKFDETINKAAEEPGFSGFLWRIMKNLMS